MAKKGKEDEKAVTVKHQYGAADIPAMLDQVNAKIKSLKGDKEGNVRITSTLGPFGQISSIKDIDGLRAAYAYITAKCEKIEGFNDVFKSIDPSAKLGKYKENGHTLEQWQEEIKAQFSSITFDDQLKRLEAVKTELEKNLSKEDKLNATLQNIAGIMNFEI